MLKTLSTSVLLFLSLFFASFASGQAVAPTLGRNNVWTGQNLYNYHSFLLNQGNSCPSGQAMTGYATDLTPICAAFSGGGVSLINGITGAAVIDNTDGNLTVSPVGQNIHINCPGCGGTGSTPGGTPGAIQYNNSGAFGGAVVTGLVKGNGTSAPSAAIPGTDFALPFVINCTTGITCPLIGSTYTFTLTGSAGTGDVASAIFGQMGGYASTGTTIGGAPNIFALNGAWSLVQMNGLFSRFSGTEVTAWSINTGTGNTTFTSQNAYNAGDVLDLQNFPVATFFNNGRPTVSATGLSNSQFEVSDTFGQSTSSGTDIGYSMLNVPAQPLVSQGVVIIDPAMQETPQTQFINVSQVGGPAAQVLDWRKGFGLQQMSAYGVKCDATTAVVTITSGQNTVSVGSFFGNTNPLGMTMVVGEQSGYGTTSLQQDWEPTVTGGTTNLTLSSHAPFSGTYPVIFGTNNQSAIQRALNDVGPFFPLWIPQCSMLSDTVRWNGASLVGLQQNFTNFFTFPGKDLFQQQDGLPIIAWSINASTGVTTFTVPSYAAHSILALSDYAGNTQGLFGDSIQLQNFPTATFFNSQNVNIATHPTPTTFTVNSAFGQSTSSGTDQGVAGPNTTVSANALRVENLQVDVNNVIDPSYSWNNFDGQTAAETVEPPYYRPYMELGANANNPFAWGVGAVNGVATITRNSTLVCAPNTGRIPAVGTNFILPYQGAGLFSTTVLNTSGSCASGFTARTLTAPTPNVAAFTSAQAEWFTFTTPQSLAVSMPASITLPYTITLNTPYPFGPGLEFSVAAHGHIAINSDQWDYTGGNPGGTAGGSPTMIIRNGPAANCSGSPLVCSVNGGAGNSVSSVVFPLNNCQAMFNNPYPVVPSINTNQTTPVNATYYAGYCAGNAAFSLPMADALAWAPFGNPGMSLAHLTNVACANFTQNALSNASNNGSMCMWQQGNYTGYGNTFDNFRSVGTQGGFVQGPAAVNQWGLDFHNIGPTSTGQSIKNCTFRTAHSIVLVNMNQSNIDRCDTYPNETSQYDGTAIGASTSLYIGYSGNEEAGGGVTGIGQFTVKDFNGEPEDGNHEYFPPSVESDGSNITWLGNIFEGGFNVFGGAYQHIIGTQLSNPVFNYGTNNYFDNMNGLNTGIFKVVYDGTLSFWNWGNFGSGDCSNGSGGGVRTMCAVGMVQSYNGHDAFATMFGDPVHPNANLLGGMILPEEFATAGAPLVYDGTELWWAKHSECSINPSSDCIYDSFDGFNGFIFVGPYQRITDTKSVVKANFRAKSSGSLTVFFQIYATNPFSSSSCVVGGVPTLIGQTQVTVTNSGWTQAKVPVDFTGYANCAMRVQYLGDVGTNILETGYLNFVPFPGEMYAPLGTPTSHAACPVAGQFQIDTNGIWICAPTTGAAFGTGTWKQSPAS